MQLNLKTYNMNKKNLFLIVAIAITLVGISGCKKSSTIPDTNTNTTIPPGPSYHFSDASGILVGLKTITFITAGGFTFPSELDTPLAVFPVSAGASTYQDAGTVTFNSKTLVKQSNNSYLYSDIANPVTYDVVHWIVSGSSGVPAIDYTEDKPIPAFANQSTLPLVITRSAGLNITLGSAITNADSVYIDVISASNSISVLKRVGGNAASVSFSASDLSVLGSGSGYLEVIPWGYKIEDISSKQYYFILESAYTVTITIN